VAFDAVHLGFRDEVSGVGDVSRLRAARLARRLARVSVLGFSRKAVLTRRQGGVAGVEFEWFAAGLEQTPKRVDDRLGLLQGGGATGSFEKGVGHIHGLL
jgi:hypothetical protein